MNTTTIVVTAITTTSAVIAATTTAIALEETNVPALIGVSILIALSIAGFTAWIVLPKGYCSVRSRRFRKVRRAVQEATSVLMEEYNGEEVVYISDDECVDDDLEKGEAGDEIPQKKKKKDAFTME